MTARTITLPSEIVEQLETLAQQQGRTLDDVLRELLEHYAPSRRNWALDIADAMERADINWQEDPSLSTTSRENFEQHHYEEWKRTQDAGNDE
jgi:predicted transcriptional regulator